MGKAWAVPQAAALAVTLVLSGEALGQPTHWRDVALAAFLALAGGMWAYAIADAAYGSKAALVATAIYAGAGVGIAAAVFEDNPNMLTIRVTSAVGVLVGLAAMAASIAEARARKGPVRWGSVAGLVLPVIGFAALLLAALLSPPSH